ncbi:Clp protease ClpP [Burkholderia plantarii]|uniref:head maturation protease, ClpP-related n=1 Tax=Burkholderia plantarii TaxID=41899 RepID=UPI00272C877B|nr:head maturation protease, ClpP-related [Burkholderia plantarii]WLE60243.1 Clp protease ClpP [Burkholderia plantarii]
MANLLLRLLNDNRSAPRKFEIANTGGDEATIYLYDVISSDDYWGGVSAATFVQQLASITAPTIHLRINSPGGDVFEALAMAQAIREHSATVIGHVDGYAASAATFLAIACDSAVMADGAMFMIHRGSCLAWGTGDDLRATADLLDKIDQTIVAMYAKKTGQSDDDIMAWMVAETWFTAEQAVELGFADGMATDGGVENAGGWNLSAYANHPANRAEPPPKPQPPDPSPKPAPEQVTETNRTVVDTSDLRRRLALSAYI